MAGLPGADIKHSKGALLEATIKNALIVLLLWRFIQSTSDEETERVGE